MSSPSDKPDKSSSVSEDLPTKETCTGKNIEERSNEKLVEPKSNSKQKEKHASKTPMLENVPKSPTSSRRKSSLKSAISKESNNLQTPTEVSSKSMKEKRSTKNTDVSTLSKDDSSVGVETPNSSKPKKGTPKVKRGLATPNNENIDNTEVDVKSKSSIKKKKKDVGISISDVENLESSPVDLNKPKASAKKKKSLISTDKTSTLAQVNEPNVSVNEEPKARGRKKSVGVEEPMFTDERLPEGWSRILTQRQGGATAGKYDVYILNPQQKRFRSRNELRNYIVQKSLDLQAEDFDFSVCGKDLKSAVTSSTTPTSLPNPTNPTSLPTPTNPTPIKKAVKRKIAAPKTTPKTIPAKKAKISPTKEGSIHDITEASDEPGLSPYFWKPTKKTVPVARIKPLVGSNKWTPPRSPYNLIQENLFHNPWQLLVATILLNKSLVLDDDITGKTATPLIYEFFKKWPTPESVEQAEKSEISKLIKPLGLHDKRAHTIKRFSVEYVSHEWFYPNELYGIGKYGNDSYKMFCINEWRSVNPSDTMLLMYKNWMVNNWRELCNNTNNCLHLPPQ